ncbi:MAG: cation:proton antiporter [Nitrospiria bacterium]
MDLLSIIALLVTLSALFSYFNYRFLKLPMSIGVMILALFLSLCLVLIGSLVPGIEEKATMLLGNIDFEKLLLRGLLGYLLFAGALHVNINDLREQKWIISSLASFGVIASTLMVGLFTFVVFNLLHQDVPFIYCLLFGALISPTDPIAVLSILKAAKAPKGLETKIAGESLFNDGIGVVVFTVLLGLVDGSRSLDPGHVILFLIEEAVGGVMLGGLLGWTVYKMLKSVDHYHVEVLITLALVMGGYELAAALHTSPAITVVVAGLLIGNRGRLLAMSDKTREHLDTFWELVDEILNASLFVLLGLEILILNVTLGYFAAGLIMIPIVLLSRFITVSIPILILRTYRTFSPGVIKILTWGGLRGGISVALALSLPAGKPRDIVLVMTYGVVIFSIIVQGLTIKRLLPKEA